MLLLFFFLMIPRPPTSPLFPYTTLFRSVDPRAGDRPAGRVGHRAGQRSPAGGELDREPVVGGGRELVRGRSEEHTSELQSHSDLVCRLLLEKKKKKNDNHLSARHSMSMN